MNDRINIPTYLFSADSAGHSRCTIGRDEFHQLATEHGYTKAAPPAKPETEAERYVRIANALPPAVRWWDEGTLYIINDLLYGAPFIYGTIKGDPYHRSSVPSFLRSLTGAMAAYIADAGWYVKAVGDGNWSIVAPWGVVRHNGDFIDAQAACCKAIHKRTKQ